MLVPVIEPSSASSDPVADGGFAVPSRLASTLSACRAASSSLLTRANHLDKRMSSSCSVFKPCSFSYLRRPDRAQRFSLRLVRAKESPGLAYERPRLSRAGRFGGPASPVQDHKGSDNFGLDNRSYSRMTAQLSPVTETTVRSNQTACVLQN
jgi:hypothetical protein